MSESPEEQPSTGVLGRIGSWFSPWRGKGPKSPSENVSPTSDQAVKLEGEEESEGSVRLQAKEQQGEEEKEESSNPNPLGLSRDIFPSKEEDATQSAHRHSFILSSTETAEGGPREEEFVRSSKKRIVQGKEREESGNGISVSGNPERNASHLTLLSSSSEQGVVRDSDWAQTKPRAKRQAQALTGKKLHVYVEETSVIKCGQDARTGQEIVRTEVTKSLQVLQKAKSSPNLYSPKSLSSTSAENKRTNVRPTVERESYYSAQGVSLTSRKDSHFEPEPDKEQTQTDSMGRKNAARRKIRKNPQVEGGTSPQEKMSPSAESVPEGFPASDNSVTSPQGKSPKTHSGQSSSVNSSSKHNPTFQASPEGLSKTSCPDSNLATEAGLACVLDGTADMEDDDSLYKVERKTETPESKRRSIKVSHGEVKLFPKNVPLNPKPAGDTEDFKSALNKTKNEATDAPKTETDARLHHLKKIDEEPKKVVGRIADKISLFERPGGGIGKPFQTPRSADVSPVRSATEKLKVNVLSEQRSRSAERYDMTRSSSASPTRERPMSIQERTRIFTEAPKTNNRAALPTKSAMTGMSQKCTLSVAVIASESPELDSQGKLDTTEHIQATAISEVTLKPDGQDTTDRQAKISIPKEQPKDIKIKDTLTSKTTDQGTKPDNVETNVSAQAPGESAELSDNISQQPKGPSRTGSRSKRRKSREPASPISPNSEKKPDCLTDKPKVTAISQEQVNNTEETSSAPRQPTEKVSLSSDKATGNTSDEQSLLDIKQKGSKKELKVVDKQKKLLDSSLKKEIIDKSLSRQEPEPSVNKDEPDTAVCISGTKKPIDKDAVISSQKEEKAGGQSLLFTQEMKETSKDSKETPVPSPSPAVEQPVEKQEPPVKNPKFDKDFSMQSEPKIKGKIKEPNKTDSGQTQQPKHKDKELINQAETKDMEKLEKSEKTNWTEKKNKQTPELPSDKNAKKVTVSDSGLGISGTEGSVAREDGRKGSERKEKTGSVKDKREPETSQPEPALGSSEKTSSDLPAQTQHITQTTSTHAQNKDAVFAVNQINGGAVSETRSEKEPSKGEMAKNVFTELQTKSTESPGTETESVVVAAEPQPVSVFVEKTENPPDDSCAHGANDAEFSSAKPITKATGTVEKVTAKATNDTPALITAQTESISEKQSSVKEPTQSFVSKSVKSEGVGQGDGNKSSTVKSVPSEDKISGDIRKITPHHPQRETSKKTGNTSNVTSIKAAEKIAKQPADSTTSSSTVTVAEKIAEKNLHPPKHDLSPVANGDISPHPQLLTIQKEPIKNKPSQTPKASASPEANKLMPDSIQHSPTRRFNLPRGLSKDDSAMLQDAPSSWLDVDFPKKRLKVPVRKLSSAVSESNLLDTSGELDDEDFIERIKKLCAPFSLPPRKHSLLRPPQPPFAMPAIKEDHFEKTFDPEEFKFGLRKEKKFTVDTTPSLLAKLQATEVKSGLKPARASLADRSMLVSSLDTHSRLRDKTSDKDEEDVKGEKDDQIRVKSRLEGSCVFSSLNSSKFKGKKNGVQTQAEGTNSREESPSEAPLVSPPPLSQPTPSSPTATAPLKETLAKQSPALNNREEVQAAEVVVTDSGPPLPSFNDIKLPDYLEKYLPREPAKAVQSMQGQEQVKTEVTEKMTPSQPACESEAGLTAKPGLVHPDAVPPSFPGIPPTTNSSVPELKPPVTQPQWTLSKTVRTAKGFHKRPGKMVLFERAPFSGQAYEIHRDVADATAMQLSPLISVKVVRGCWVLYEKPDFQGRCIALEEGVSELTNEWAEPGQETEPQSNPPVLIGSIRLVVSDYSIPHIDLFTEPEGLGRVTPYHDDTIETGSFGIPLSTASIQVHSGVWLVFSDPGFQGMLAVLETGVYPFPETWGFPSPFVGSLRPLKMGGLKVENPNEVKALVYEKPGFEGSCLEIDSDVFSFCENEGGISADGANLDSKKPKSVGSLKIIGGLWVGYSDPGFEGQQHILEEGEYLDCSSWGGSEQLMSLRPILADFMSPHLKMFSDRDFSELGVNIDLTVPVINMGDTGYGTKTQSLDVIGGVWVVFEEQGFCGEPYILEKGLYGSPEDWGALQPRVASAMPVVLDDFENAAKFKVQLFSEPGFQGSILALEDSVGSLQDGFSVASCKVLAGNWLAFEGQDFSGRMYVLEQGNYSDLRAMGCFQAGSSILSLQTVGFEFSLPSITLFERCGLRGKRVILTDGSVNLQLAGGCSRVQSLLVEGGMWVLYEEINYRGAQILLKPGELPEWRTFSNWLKIGSLRPLMQKQVHFRLRNSQTGLMMSVTGDLDNVKLMRIQETKETDGLEQIWLYQNGHLHCKLLEECCLSPSGSVTMAGSRVGLIPPPEHQAHLWSITPEGFIRYIPTPDLVLEVKGGHHYDKNQVILNTIDPNKPHQLWNVEVI